MALRVQKLALPAVIAPVVFAAAMFRHGHIHVAAPLAARCVAVLAGRP